MKESIEFKKLYSWLCSWRQKDGYGGFLHHAIHGTVNWEHARLVPSYTYEPLINGFLNLYANTDNPVWLRRAEQAADDLIAILDNTHQFRYSGFEFAPKSGSIVHTVNPLFAFMKLYAITHNKKYIEICKKVLESIACIYWRGNNFAGPFNMTLTVSAAMAEYGALTGDWRLHEIYGKHSFQLIKDHQCQEGPAAGLYYRNSNDHSIVFPWYNSVKANAMIRYGTAVKDPAWINEGKKLLQNIRNLFYADFSLPHSFQDGDLLSVPTLVAPAAFCLTLMQKYHILSEKEIASALESFLNMQTEIGFFPANKGYDWRSRISVTAWNAFVFEWLSENYILDNDSVLPLPEYTFQEGKISGRETETLFELFYQGQLFCSIEKKNGQITKHPLASHDFSVSPEYLSKAPHFVRLSRQRHFAVSYIDDAGNGIWLEDHNGPLYVWSPYSLFDVQSDYQLTYRGQQRYDKFARLLYSVIHPVMYVPGACSLFARLLNR